MLDKSVVICGAGVVGLVLAKVLSDLGYKVDIYAGKNRQIISDIMVHAANSSTVNLLKNINAWDNLSVSSIKKMVVCDEQHNFFWEFLAQDVNQLQIGHVLNVKELHEVLMKLCLDCENINVFYSNIVCLKNNNFKVYIEDDFGNKKSYSWLFASDGKNSWVRSQVKQRYDVIDHGQRAIVATLNLEHGFQNNAWQKFLTTGPVALLPRADGLYALIWSAKESFAKELLSMSDSCFEKTLLNKVGADFGKMKLASNKYSFSLVSSYTKKLYNKRCIFLGDAARFIHPLFGQGANMGFLDVLAIKDIITRKDKNVGKVFHNTRYQDGITLGKAADIINENACWNNKLMAETRARLGLFIINAPCAKRFLINHALGKRFNQHTNYKCSWPEY